MTPDNDPGSAAAAARVAALESVASEPLQLDGGGKIFVGTASWTDPTMTAAGEKTARYHRPGPDVASQPQ